MEAFPGTPFNPRIAAEYAPNIPAGALIPVILLLLIVVCGAGVGTAPAYRGSDRLHPVETVVVVHASVFRVLPPVVPILLVFFELPIVDVVLSAPTVLFVAPGAFAGEIVRSGITPHGQREAACSSGPDTGVALLHVTSTQAARDALPDPMSNGVGIAKPISLASGVSPGGMPHAAGLVRSLSDNVSPLVLAAGIHLAPLWPAIRPIARSERRIAT